ncbi:hypothetical protein TRFO_43080 [Tritrichomonas foetus]|uniref:Uncharacterized protein n=1 Tax=Tritrichomonas foetus TaxID=1144522 RepID=A0A1J4KSW8_9EUKA|nr:hypothetical protein TRFO_43080 [Tritrichomonas foetus]|eukprot:OHT14391.1 hypothetical protein TRFO_43080 [Tritrichomonas foetus]
MKGRKIKSIKNDDPPSDAAAIPSSPSPSKKNVKPKMSQTPQPILNEKEDKMFDNAQKSLEELRKIKFYLQLLTDKFVPQEIQEQALKARLDAAKARISQVPELPTTANVTTSTSVPNV